MPNRLKKRASSLCTSPRFIIKEKGKQSDASIYGGQRYFMCGIPLKEYPSGSLKNSRISDEKSLHIVPFISSHFKAIYIIICVTSSLTQKIIIKI